MDDRTIDITEDQHRFILAEIRRYLPDTTAWVYGSRAKWTSRPQSDLDLVVFAKPGQNGQVESLREAFEESDLPFRVDLFVWDKVPEGFRGEIEAEYVVLVGRSSEHSEDRKSSELDDWREVVLGDLIDIKHGFAFKGQFIRGEPHENVLLTPGNFAIGGGFKADKFKYYCGEIADDSVLFEGDLIVSMTDLSKQSDTLGYPAFVPNYREGKRYLHNQRLGKITLKNTETDAQYIYYVMCGVEYRHEILASATGTTVKHTSPDRIKQFRFRLPSLPEQRAIAHILGTLDDKIELNRRMNETLEAMARALFKSWFVDFDPVRAKMEGRDTGLPDEVATLFPDRMVDSELGEIPEGWEVNPLDTIAVFQNGLALQKFRPQANEKRLPVVKIAQLRNEKTDSGEWAASNISPKCIIDDGDIVFSWSGSLMVKVWCSGRAALNQHLFKVTSTRFSKWFLLHSVNSHLVDFQAIAAGKATTMGHIKRHHLSDAKCVVPNSQLLAVAEHPLATMFERSVSTNVQSRILTNLRDSLLPKLVSGDIRLKDVEQFAEIVQ